MSQTDLILASKSSSRRAMSKRKACCKCGHLPEEDSSGVEEIPDENVTPNKRSKKTTTTYFDRDFDVATTKEFSAC